MKLTPFTIFCSCSLIPPVPLPPSPKPRLGTPGWFMTRCFWEVKLHQSNYLTILWRVGGGNRAECQDACYFSQTEGRVRHTGMTDIQCREAKYKVNVGRNPIEAAM